MNSINKIVNHQNRNIKHLQCIVFVLLIVPYFLIAQTDYHPITPAAAQFEKFINYPTDLSTGATSVSVPIYALKAGNMQIPVNISYHTAGVKVADPSLPVGLGWVLNPGGRVTRRILGSPDESLPFHDENFGTLSFAEQLEYARDAEVNPPASNDAGGPNNDSEYDIFTYHTGTGLSGRFIIQEVSSGNYEAIPLIETRDKIELSVVSNQGAYSIPFFKVTDENGTQFHFGQGISNYSTNVSSSRSENQTGQARSGWMLTDIVSADLSDTVSFIWKTVRNDATNRFKTTQLHDVVTVMDKWSEPSITPENSPYNPYIGFDDAPQYDTYYSDSYFIMNTIEGIKYRNKEIKFDYTSGIPTKLNRVEIHSNGSEIKRVNFHTSTFNNGALKLDYLSFQDDNNSEVFQYQFGYNTTQHPNPSNTRAIDFWGYYNGSTANNLVPNFTYTVDNGTPFTQSFTSTSRAPSSNAQASILNSVIYPTGGKTTYEYELNKIYKQGQLFSAGGLRVKSISHWASDGQLAEKKSYTYGINGSNGGDGIVMEASLFTRTTAECPTITYNGSTCSGIVHFRKRLIQDSPNGDLYTFDFPSVTYQEVTEYIGNPTGSNSGKIIYNYSPQQYFLSTMAYSYDRFAKMGRFWDTPRLLSKTHYQNNGGNYSKVSSTSTRYASYIIENIFNWKFNRYANFYHGFSASNCDPLSYYEENLYTEAGQVGFAFAYGSTSLVRGGTAIDLVQEISYGPNGDSIVVEKDYQYSNNEYLYPSALTVTNSGGQSFTTHYKYPKDYSVGSNPSNVVAQGIKLLKDRNVVTPVIEEYTETLSGYLKKDIKFTTYNANTPHPNDTYYISSLTIPQTFALATITASSHNKSSHYENRLSIDLYDVDSNVRQATNHQNGIKTVILYSYNNQLPICVAQNTTFSEVVAELGGVSSVNNFASNPTPTDTQINNFFNTLRNELPDAQITTYTYHPYFQSMTSQTDPNGITTYYEYDSYNRLLRIKDVDGYVLEEYTYNYKD